MKSIFKVIVLLALACFSNVLFGSMKQGNTRVINVGKWLNTSTSVKSRVPPVIVTVLPLTPSLFVLAKA